MTLAPGMIHPETGKELEQLGAQPLLLRGNLGDPGKAAALVEQAGELDVLVSNAATGVIRPALEIEEKHWDWTMNANARALLTLTRHAVPSMPQGSSIVAISSLGAQRVLEDYVVVGVSKAALIRACIAREVGAQAPAPDDPWDAMTGWLDDDPVDDIDDVIYGPKA